MNERMNGRDGDTDGRLIVDFPHSERVTQVRRPSLTYIVYCHEPNERNSRRRHGDWHSGRARTATALRFDEAPGSDFALDFV